MKKIYFIILLISSINAVGQKYKFTFAWQPVLQSGESYTLKVGNSQIDKYYQKNNGIPEYIDYEFQLNPTDNLLFELDAVVTNCAWIPGQFFKFSLQDMMLGFNTMSDQCAGTSEIIHLKPSEIALSSLMVPENTLEIPTHYTICSGAQLEIFATIPNKNPIVNAENYYPPSAFHWQYSLDKENWIDVPEYILKNGVSTKNASYNTPKLIASMDEIIGSNHKDYYNKIIYFQLGCNRAAYYYYFQDYDPTSINGLWRNTTYASLDYGVLYLPCTPNVDGDISLEIPDCSYHDIKQIKIPFDRDLEAGEELRDMSLYNNITPGTPSKTINTPVVYQNKNYFFPVDDITLIPNAQYQIKYVAYKNNKPRAVGFSNFFNYTQPKKLSFKVNANNPKCNIGKVDINIEAEGGTPPYYYDNLNGETEIINGISQIKRIQFDVLNPNKKTTTIEQVESKEYNIKVTDSNYCIEN